MFAANGPAGDYDSRGGAVAFDCIGLYFDVVDFSGNWSDGPQNEAEYGAALAGADATLVVHVATIAENIGVPVNPRSWRGSPADGAALGQGDSRDGRWRGRPGAPARVPSVLVDPGLARREAW